MSNTKRQDFCLSTKSNGYLRNSPKIKKAIHKSGKLFIGLTTKPCYELQSRSENNTTILDAFFGQKRFSFLKTFFPI